jgi:pilus assembly protein CpaB
MNIRMVLLAVFAIVSAAVTFFLAKTWIDSQRDEMRRHAESMQSNTTESVNILVAKANLPSGLILAREHVEWKPWPEKGVVANYLMEGREKADDIVGHVVRGGIIAGEPITKGRVIAPGDRGFMAAVLRPDMRAVSIRVKPETSVAGFIKPGDHIDLVLLHEAKPPEAEPAIKHKLAETILNDLRVIAVDQRPDDQDGSASVSKTITLEVTKKQAETVLVSSRLGTLSVVLRSLARPEAHPDQLAKAPERRTRTWDAEASQVLPPLGRPANKLQVIRGVNAAAIAVPPAGAIPGQGTGTLFAPAASETANSSADAGATAAKVITP